MFWHRLLCKVEQGKNTLDPLPLPWGVQVYTSEPFLADMMQGLLGNQTGPQFLMI